MANHIRLVDYYYTTVQDQPGEAYRLLNQLAGQGINLLAFTAVPIGPKSWCMQTPFSFMLLPLSANPSSAWNDGSRIPNTVSYSSLMTSSRHTRLASVD